MPHQAGQVVGVLDRGIEELGDQAGPEAGQEAQQEAYAENLEQAQGKLIEAVKKVAGQAGSKDFMGCS